MDEEYLYDLGLDEETLNSINSIDIWNIAWKNKFLKLTENLRSYQDDKTLREVLLYSTNIVKHLDGKVYAYLSKGDELLIVPTERPLFEDEEIYSIVKNNVIFLFSYNKVYNNFQYEGILFIERIENKYWEDFKNTEDYLIGNYRILYSSQPRDQLEIYCGLSLEEIHEKSEEFKELLKDVPKSYGNLEEVIKTLVGYLSLKNFM